MSDLAEYARRLHESGRREYPRELRPCGERGAYGSLKGVRAVIFDVYGTMVNYWREGFGERRSREELLLAAFTEVADRFGMNDTLVRMNPADPAGKTLHDFYNGLVALNYRKSAGGGAEFPEVRVDEVWAVVVMMLKRNGYDVDEHLPDGASASEFHRYLAYTYNFFSMGRELYPGVAGALWRLKSDNIVLGILSDAQLYTPIDLTLLLRDQSRSSSMVIDDYNEVFDPDLTFFSYEYGFVKPSAALYRRLFDALYEYRVTPSQTVFVGNDLASDIGPAAALGMRTALFGGDDVMLFGANESGGNDNRAGGNNIVPDIIFNDWHELPEMISFHGENES